MLLENHTNVTTTILDKHKSLQNFALIVLDKILCMR